MADDWTRMEVQGLEELERKLGELDNQLAGKALFGALNYGARPMLKEAKERALESETAYRRYMSSGQGESTLVETKRGKFRRGKAKRARRGEGKYVIQAPGTLKRSVRLLRLNKKMREKFGVKDGASVGIFVKQKKGDLPPYYWYFIEYGTSKMPATPFLRPAFDNNVELMISRFSEKLNENIDKYGE